jgi:hypothetical protein
VVLQRAINESCLSIKKLQFTLAKTRISLLDYVSLAAVNLEFSLLNNQISLSFLLSLPVASGIYLIQPAQYKT